MIKILADAHIPYLKGVAEQLGDVEYLPGNRFTREAIKIKTRFRSHGNPV